MIKCGLCFESRLWGHTESDTIEVTQQQQQQQHVLKVGGTERFAARGERKKSSLIAKIFLQQKR